MVFPTLFTPRMFLYSICAKQKQPRGCKKRARPSKVETIGNANLLATRAITHAVLLGLSQDL